MKRSIGETTNRLIHDEAYRSRALPRAYLAASALYGVFKCILGILFRSQWMGAIGVYFIFLTGIHYLLLIAQEKNPGERGMQLCRIGVSVLMLVLAGIINALIVKILKNGESYYYPGFLIYIFALYALIKMTVAVVTFVRSRGRRTPLKDAEQNLVLVEASVGILALVTALLAQFGSAQEADLRFGVSFVMCTLVFVLTLEVTVRMFLASGRELKKLRKAAD